MKYYSFRYSLRVWLSSVLTAPIIYVIIQCCIGADQFGSGMHMYPIIVVFELIMSFATWLVFWCITGFLNFYLNNSKWRKWMLFSSGVVITIATFLVFSFSDMAVSLNNMPFALMLSNCFCIGFACWLCRLEAPIPSRKFKY